MTMRGITIHVLLVLAMATLAPGCEDDMADQPRYEAYEASTLFADGQASRPIPEHTVARGHLRSNEHLYQGKVDGQPATNFPFPVSREWLERGRQRYDIFCAVCHGATGDGNGMIVQRGFTPPPSLHIDRLRQAPVGHYYDVISNGWGAMFSYNDRIKPEDRWAIIMYIRALQLSQTATIRDVPPDEMKKLEATTP